MGILDKLKKKDEENVEEAKTATVKAAPKKNATSSDAKSSGVTKEKKVEESKEVKSVATKVITDTVLVKPFISEKAVMQEAKGIYTFVVKNKATKVDVKKAVKAVYGVIPAKVRMLNMEGKRTSFGIRRGKRSDWKKAVVTLPKGKTISIHEGV